MKKKTLPVHVRLRSLQTTARFAPGALRIIAEPGAADPLIALLREVNETILGRNLQFSTDTGVSLAMDVAGRRILRVTAAKGVEGAESCLAIAALEDAQREDLGRLLTAFARSGGEIRVLSAALGRNTDGMSVGLPVARLAEFLSIDLHADKPAPVADEVAIAAGPEDFLQAFIAQMGDGLTAWLIRSTAEVLGRFGPEEMVTHLEDFLADEFDALGDQLDQITLSPDEPVCTVLGADLLAGHSILCLRAAGSVLLGVVSGDAAGQTLAAWNAARR